MAAFPAGTCAEALAELFMPMLESKGIKADKDFVTRVVALIKERATFVQDFWTIASYLFIDPSQFAEFGVKAGAASEKPADPNRPVDPRAKGYDDAATAPFLAKDVDQFWKPEVVEMASEALKNSDAASLEEYIRSHEMPMGKVMNCIRLALTGASSGLGIADIISFIGKDKAVERMEFAKGRLA